MVSPLTLHYIKVPAENILSAVLVQLLNYDKIKPPLAELVHTIIHFLGFYKKKLEFFSELIFGHC